MIDRVRAGRVRAALLSVLLPLAACSSGDGATHAPLPQVENNGGGTLTAPEIVTVTFDPDLYLSASVDLTAPQASAMLSDLQSFDDGITSTTWWATVTEDYCSPGCTGQAGAHVTIAAEPPGDGSATCYLGPNGQAVQPCYTDTAIGGSATLKTYLTGLFGDGTLPAPTAQTLYVFYLPSSVAINVDGSATCVAIGGYHDSVTVGALSVPYAIVPVCPPESTVGNAPELTVEQTATMAASHEIVEATTDPHAGEMPAGESPQSTQDLGWYLTDPANQAWAFFAGGEIADLCVDLFGLGQDRWTEGSYVYQRVWSNTRAAANMDPCVPVPAGEVYFNAGPRAVDDEQIEIPVGGQGGYEVAAFSDGAMPGWQVAGVDFSAALTGNPQVLAFAPSTADPATVSNGSSLPLGMTLESEPLAQPNEPAEAPAFEGYAILSLVTTAGVPTAAHYWPGFVIVP